MGRGGVTNLCEYANHSPKIFKAIEERHENSPTPKSPDFTGQGNVRFVCSSVFIFRHIRISPQKYENSQISEEYQGVFFIIL